MRVVFSLVLIAFARWREVGSLARRRDSPYLGCFCLHLLRGIQLQRMQFGGQLVGCDRFRLFLAGNLLFFSTLILMDLHLGACTKPLDSHPGSGGRARCDLPCGGSICGCSPRPPWQATPLGARRDIRASPDRPIAHVRRNGSPHHVWRRRPTATMVRRRWRHARPFATSLSISYPSRRTRFRSVSTRSAVNHTALAEIAKADRQARARGSRTHHGGRGRARAQYRSTLEFELVKWLTWRPDVDRDGGFICASSGIGLSSTD